MKKILLLLIFACSPLYSQKNALWIWNTSEILKNPSWRDSIVLATDELEIKTLFLYAPHTYSINKDTCILSKKEYLFEFLQWLKQKNFSIHLMAGEPEWALTQYHQQALAFVQAVVEFNAETGMVDGIQFDIEPYLLLPFSLPKARDVLLKNWIHLLWTAGKIIRESPGLQYGAAVPFWLDDPLVIEGKSYPAVRHIQFLTDYVAVMAYRDQASGNGSIIQFSEDERRWAEESRRSIYIGVETSFLGGASSTFLCETDVDSFERLIDSSCGSYRRYYYGKRKLSVQTIDGRVLIGVSGRNLDFEEAQQIQQGLMECFSAVPIRLQRAVIERFVKRSGEWNMPEYYIRADSSFTIRMERKEAKKSTMWYLTPNQFANEMNILTAYASAQKAVTGIAVHDLKSVLRLLKGKK